MSNSLLVPQTYSELLKWAEMAAKTEMVLKALRGKPADIVLAVQYGSQLGLTIMESLRGVAVINGNPGVFGDAMLALCKRHPEFEACIETPQVAPTGEINGYICEARRKGQPPVIHKFDVDDAKRAKLWGKTGSQGQDTPWITYPQRMLQMRARSFALRDQFADMLRGFVSVEELQDYPTIDGASSADTITSQQLSQLVELLTDTGTDTTSFLATMFSGVTRLEDVPARDFNRAIGALSQKKARMPAQ